MAADKPAPQAPDELRVSRHQVPEPRLPHERDQSADPPGQATDRDTGRRAAIDAERGMPDTGPAPVMEELARKQFGPAPASPSKRNDRRG